MKKLLTASLFALAATSGFASTCFVADKDEVVKANLPQIVCVDSQKLEMVVPELPRQPFLEFTVVADVGISSRQDVRLKEVEGELFEAKLWKTINQQGIPCGENSHSFLEYSLKVTKDLAPVIFTVTGVHTSSNDSCHSSDRVTKIEYTAI